MMVEGIANTKVRRGSSGWKLGIPAALVVLLGAVSVPASANPVTFDFIESNPSSGVYEYDYTVTNTGEWGPGFDIYEQSYAAESIGGAIAMVNMPGGKIAYIAAATNAMSASMA